jgi:hypothetical protein
MRNKLFCLASLYIYFELIHTHTEECIILLACATEVHNRYNTVNTCLSRNLERVIYGVHKH